MSAFGYGGSYFPSWRGQQQSLNTQSDPLFNIAPEMVRPNFNPVASDPWIDAAKQVRPGNSSTNDLLNQVPSKWGGDLGAGKWSNPIEGLSGYVAPDYGKQSLGSSFSPQKPGLGGPAPTSNYGETSDPMELYRRSGQMTQQQMMQLSGQMPQLQQAYGLAAQRLANAYANPRYQRTDISPMHTNYENGGYGTDMDKNTAMMYLQGSYQRTLDRMNKNFLL